MAEQGQAVIVLAAEDRTGPAFQSARRNMAALQADSRKTAFQQQQLAFQLNDLFVQIASGGSPLTAIIQQGSQLSGTFGGVGNAFRAVLGLITPMRAGLLGLGAGLGVFALGAASAENFARSLGDVQAALAGSGRSGSFSDSQIAGLIQQISEVPGVTREAAEQTVAEFARIREISGDMFLGLGKLAADYARVTGKEVPAAAKELGKAFASPEQGAKTLEGALGTLSSATLLTVQRLSDQGDIIGAQRALYDELTRKIGGLASEGFTPLQRATDDLSTAWDRLTGSFSKSEGFERANDNIAKFLGLVERAIEALPRLELGATNAFRGSRFGNFIGIPESTGGASGTFGEPQNTGGASGSFGDQRPALPAPQAQSTEDAIKRSLELGKSYQTTSAKIAELTNKQAALRDGLRLATTEYGANSEQAKRLRDSVAAVGEQIDTLRKKGQKRGDREGEQVRRAELEQQLRGIQAGLEEEQSAVRFNNEFLRGQYQDGEISLREFYTRQRAEIDRGVAAKVEALENERAAVEVSLSQTRDPSERVRLETRRADINTEIKRTGEDASRERALAIQDEAKAYRDLEESVRSFQAQLAAASGQEFTAETAQIETTIQRALTLATQSGGSITQDQIQTLREQLTIRAQINESQRTFSLLSSQASNAEERLVITARANGQGLIETEEEIRAVRQQALDQLGTLIEQTKAYAASSKDPSVLQYLDDLQTRYAQLQEVVDPRKLRFDAAADNIGSAIADGLERAVVEGGKLSDILKGIERDIVSIITREAITKPLAEGIGNIVKGTGSVSDLGAIFWLGGRREQVSAAAPVAGALAGGSQILGGLFGVMERAAPLTEAVNGQAEAFANLTASTTAEAVASEGASAALGGLPGAIQTVTNVLSSFGGDIVSSISGLFGGGGAGGGSSFVDFFASFFHEGGVVGEAKDLRKVSFDGAPRYHTGGIAGLKADEVPSVLLKGEEVLTHDDPRHRDNLSTKVFERLQSMKEGASLSTLEGFDTSSIATEKLIERISSDRESDEEKWSEVTRYHTGGIAGLAPDEVPAVLKKGEEVLTQADPRHRDNGGGRGDVISVNVQAQPGMSRATALQQGRDIADGIALARRRNG